LTLEALEMGFFLFHGVPRWPLILLGVLALVGVIVGIVGIVLWAGEKNDEKYFRGPVDGKVVGGGVDEERCSEEHCTGSTSKEHCTTHHYTCYRAYWKVEYRALNPPEGDGEAHTGEASSSTTYKSKSSARNYQKSEHVEGKEYPCWYDTSDYSSVRWTKPNSTPFLIMWIVGFSAAAPFLLFIIGFLVFRLFQTSRSGYQSI
jgi:hypothetical protein